MEPSSPPIAERAYRKMKRPRPSDQQWHVDPSTGPLKRRFLWTAENAEDAEDTVHVAYKRVCSLLKKREVMFNRTCRSFTRVGSMAGKLKINELYIRDIREAEQNALKWDSINRELPAAITTYSKASCLKFCRKLHSTLPRELRDLVYEHLCNREYSIGVGPRRTMPFASHTHHDAHRKAHYLDPSFVDTEMSIEIAEAYYRTNCFRIYDSYQLKNFLTDTTLNNIAPALFLRRMTVELRGDIREVVDYGFTVDRVWRSCEALRKSLQILFCISRMKSFDLEILVSAHCDKVLNNILESLRPTYQRLKQFGFNVEVTFHKFEAYLHMKHLTHFFECTRAEWDALVRSYRQANYDSDMDSDTDLSDAESNSDLDSDSDSDSQSESESDYTSDSDEETYFDPNCDCYMCCY